MAKQTKENKELAEGEKPGIFLTEKEVVKIVEILGMMPANQSFEILYMLQEKTKEQNKT